MATSVTLKIRVNNIEFSVPVEVSNSDINVEISAKQNGESEASQQICPYSLTELLHLYKREFPGGCYDYEKYLASPFYQKYILGNKDD
ncbi:Hypothetical protein HVR_LOCUS496 [uncultured virus]|nr:Hypothetical protein HVR_LOCUS496 [uncultured virus]